MKTVPTQLAAMFRALSDPTRLHIFDYLRSCCGPVELDAEGNARRFSGPTAGEVCCRVTGADRITPAISHHLRELLLAGLITVERHGKHKVYAINPEAIRMLAVYFGDPGGSSHEPGYQAEDRSVRLRA